MEDAKGDDAEALNRRCSNVSSDHTAKKQRRAQDFGDDVDDYYDLEEKDNEKPFHDVLSFRLFYKLSVWMKPRTKAIGLTVAIFLPMGIGCNDYSVRVLGEGRHWKCVVYDPRKFHRLRLYIENGYDNLDVYHPKLFGLEAFLKECI